MDMMAVSQQKERIKERARFSCEFNFNAFYDSLSEQQSKILQLASWVIDDDDEFWLAILNHLEISKITQMRFKVPQQHIPKAVIDLMPSVQFIKLYKLLLNHLNLTNISFLSAMNCPELQILSLDHNFIFEVKALRKCGFNSLKILGLQANLVKQVPSNGYFANKPLKSLQLESLNQKRNRIENLNIESKLQLKESGSLRIIAGSRIKIKMKKAKYGHFDLNNIFL